MSTFVLVHGAFHGGWAWEKVAPLLAARGHRAVALDMPGHGEDATPLAGLALRDYVARVTDAIDREPEPVVLVGHSLGGVVVTQAAEERAEKIRTLVYVVAFMPKNGQTLLEIAKTDDESLLVKNLVIDEAAGLHWCIEDAVRETFYADCSDADVARARRRLVREPLSIPTTPVRLTPERFGRVPRVYVECTNDRALGIAAQRRMIDASPGARVITMAASHSPFFSSPDALAEHLASV
jgi:pimeloyl-ACP methyl ester carboxylesterase